MRSGKGHGLFVVAMIGKGLDGLLELAGGVLLLTAKPQMVSAMVTFLTEHELSGDAGDKIAHLLHAGIHHLSSHDSVFASAYLLGHGAVKLFLVAGLLRGKLWVYPVALWFLGAFAVYQGYRIAVDGSVAMIVLTAFDLIVIALIWREYRHREDES